MLSKLLEISTENSLPIHNQQQFLAMSLDRWLQVRMPATDISVILIFYSLQF